MKKVAVSVHATDNFNPKIIERLNGLDFIHVDIMDGKFVDNECHNLNVLKILKEKYNIPLIAHLMVINPYEYIEKISDYIDFIVFHIEFKGDIKEIINIVKGKDKKIGLAINPDTDLDEILPFLQDIDLILVMSVQPGWSGQKFIPEIVEKVNSLVAYRFQNKLKFLIDVDGGVNSENCKLLNSEILSSASAILNADDPNSVIRSMKNS